MDNLEFEVLSVDEVAGLEEPFEEREVREVIKGMDRDKALGPDGFSLAFYQDCWEVVKGDFMVVFVDFHSQGKFVKSINSTFVSLIPKFHGAKEPIGFSSYGQDHFQATKCFCERETDFRIGPYYE